MIECSQWCFSSMSQLFVCTAFGSGMGEIWSLCPMALKYLVLVLRLWCSHLPCSRIYIKLFHWIFWKLVLVAVSAPLKMISLTMIWFHIASLYTTVRPGALQLIQCLQSNYTSLNLFLDLAGLGFPETGHSICMSWIQYQEPKCMTLTRTRPAQRGILVFVPDSLPLNRVSNPMHHKSIPHYQGSRLDYSFFATWIYEFLE